GVVRGEAFGGGAVFRLDDEQGAEGLPLLREHGTDGNQTHRAGVHILQMRRAGGGAKLQRLWLVPTLDDEPGHGGLLLRQRRKQMHSRYSRTGAARLLLPERLAVKGMM